MHLAPQRLRSYTLNFNNPASPPQVVGCSCAVVTDYGDDSEGRSVLQAYLNK